MERLQALFNEDERPDNDGIRAILDELATEWEGRPLALQQVASGWRFQVRTELAPWLNRLSEEKTPRYSRALLETLALIVYRQPITRAGIEEIRGVSVSSNIIRTLLERDWIRVVGHRDVPGKPALFGTTKKFLDYFNLKSLSDLPPLADIQPLDHLQEEFSFPGNGSDDGTGEPHDEVVHEEAAEDDAAAKDDAAEDDADARREAREPAEALH
jgi:segregation and condensation protein B